jgi:hypothetical protein
MWKVVYFILFKIVVGGCFRFKRGRIVWCLKVWLQCWYQENKVNGKLNILLWDDLDVGGQRTLIFL